MVSGECLDLGTGALLQPGSPGSCRSEPGLSQAEGEGATRAQALAPSLSPPAAPLYEEMRLCDTLLLINLGWLLAISLLSATCLQ